MLAWIGTHWLLSSFGIGLVALIVFAPAIAATIGRWLIGTEVGRYLLLAAIVVSAGVYAWDARFSAGRAAGLAECAASRANSNEKTAEQVSKGEDAGADATKAARQSADNRQADRDDRQPRVESYARNAADPCKPSADLVRELEAGEGRFRSASRGMRGDGHAKGEGPEPTE